MGIFGEDDEQPFLQKSVQRSLIVNVVGLIGSAKGVEPLPSLAQEFPIPVIRF
jgi:hypothetical protein